MLAALYDHGPVYHSQSRLCNQIQDKFLHFDAQDHGIAIVAEFQNHPLPRQMLRVASN